MQVNSVSVNNQNRISTNQPQFGRVIKSRFFELMPDGSKKQIQDINTIKTLCGRLTYHLSEPWKYKKNRAQILPDFLRKIDYDYSIMPTVRRIFNFNKPKDHCFYLITGNDAASLNRTAFIEKGADKKKKIIERHWQLVRDNQKRLYDKENKELSLNIYLKNCFNPKTKKDQMYLNGIELIREEKLQFPYRFPGEDLK